MSDFEPKAGGFGGRTLEIRKETPFIKNKLALLVLF
jgi:hypothetical protein